MINLDYITRTAHSLLKAKGVNITLADTKEVVNGLMNQILQSIATGQELSIRGLGKFVFSTHKGSVVPHPKASTNAEFAGQKIDVPARTVLKFRPSTIIKGIVAKLPIKEN